MRAYFKSTDKEGRVRLGGNYANKQWEITELDNGSIVLIPMVTATSDEASSLFDKAMRKHKKTIDALK